MKETTCGNQGAYTQRNSHMRQHTCRQQRSRTRVAMAMEKEATRVENANTKAEKEDTREKEKEKEKEKAKDMAHQGRACREDASDVPGPHAGANTQGRFCTRRLTAMRTD